MEAEKLLIVLGPIIVLAVLAAFVYLSSKGREISKFIVIIFCFTGLGLTALGLGMNIDAEFGDIKMKAKDCQEIAKAAQDVLDGQCDSAKKKLLPFKSLLNKQFSLKRN